MCATGRLTRFSSTVLVSLDSLLVNTSCIVSRHTFRGTNTGSSISVSVSPGEITVLRTSFFFKNTAGKDRTGVVAGMLQALAGTPPDAVLFDYMLSRIGFEPIREQMLFTAVMDTGGGAMATEGFFNMNSIRPTYWTAFQALVDERFGGWDGYVTGELGFSAEDLETIKRHLRGGQVGA